MKQKMTTAKKPMKKAFGGNIMKKVANAVKGASSAVKNVAKSAPAAKAAEASPAAKVGGGKGFRGMIGRALRGPAVRKALGFKTGGSVMADKSGRAMKRKTADARGRAMKGK